MQNSQNRGNMNKVNSKPKMIKNITTRRMKIAAIAMIAAFTASILMPAWASADNFDAKIKQLQAQNAQNKEQAKVLQAQANSYQESVNQLQAQINQIQAQIAENTAKSNDLQRQIEEAEAELNRQRKLMSESIRKMYLEGQISTLEMLASSKDISEFVDKQQYRNSVQNQIKETLDKVNKLKAQLRTQKEQIAQLLKEQEAMQAQVSADRNKQAELLAYTQAQKAEFDAQIKATNAEIAKQEAAQAAYYASISGGGTRNYGTDGPFAYRNYVPRGYCGGGYNYCWAAYNQIVSDPWGLSYARQCVHYTADRAASHMNLRGYFGNGRGNATNWPTSLARAPGVHVDVPAAPGTVAVKMAGGRDIYGHTMYVEEVLDDGWVRVSQMNWGPSGSYSTMEVKASGVIFIAFDR